MGKACFEREAALHGVKIKHKMTDNDMLTASTFIDEIHENDQKLTFSGVDAHRIIRMGQQKEPLELLLDKPELSCCMLS